MEFNLKFDEPTIQVLVTALNELPRKLSQPVLELMQAQINEQLAKPPETVKRPYKKRGLKLVPPQDKHDVVA